MYLEVKQWPESQNVMDDPEYFFIAGSGDAEGVIGSSAYAKVIDINSLIQNAVDKAIVNERNRIMKGLKDVV